MTRLPLLPLLAALALSACGAPHSKSNPEPDAGTAEAPFFLADAQPDGPALWLSAARTDDGQVVVSVHAQKLGPIFGHAFHLRFDPAALALDDAAALNVSELGLDHQSTVWRHALPSEATIGVARNGPAAGEQDPGDGVLASIKLRPQNDATVRLDLSKVSVRKADGSYLKVALAGGTLNLAGGAR